MNNSKNYIECNICTSIIDISPTKDLKCYDTIESGKGIFFVCQLCKEIAVQLFRCANCLDLCVLDFTTKEMASSPNVCHKCGKVVIYSTVELLPMIEMNRQYL